ncbi:MAG: M23 family metallopeptidase [Myxococcota bacterium]
MRVGPRVVLLMVTLLGCRSHPAARMDAPWRQGHCAHDDVPWRLPFPAGVEHQVMQANRGAFSHLDDDLYAWDFRMPPGSPVTAAADGVVVRVTDHHTQGGPDRRLAERANVVVVRHGTGRFSVYQHLAPHSARVRVGRAVKQGEVLALSGNTGWSWEPHLHFEVVDRQNRSQPICFVDVPGGVPHHARRYRSGNILVTPAQVTPRPALP